MVEVAKFLPLQGDKNGQVFGTSCRSSAKMLVFRGAVHVFLGGEVIKENVQGVDFFVFFWNVEKERKDMRIK